MKQTPVTRDEVLEIVKTEVKESERRLSDKLDAVMGKLQKVGDEFTLQMGKYEQINDHEDMLDDHEKRIKKLEHPTL